MYEKLKGLSLEQQVEMMTRTLVAIPAINSTEGELERAEAIKDCIATFPYFKEHPDLVWEEAIPGDPYGRKNIFALLEGESRRTVIWHAHIDTVGVEDFGSLEKNAFDPDTLLDYFSGLENEPEVKKDALSGEWLFGRGALDMQSGAAVHLVNLLRFSEAADTLDGNILVMFNPDEEGGHAGVIAATETLTRLKNEEGFDYAAAINDDFISPLYENDDTRYLYTGAAGKVLPSFFIYGRETHVGETLKGVEATRIASEINRRINNNMALAEVIEGEVVNPPTCLFLRDAKAAYNVQTPFKAYMYFNYFLYERTPREVIGQLKQETIAACRTVTKDMQAHYQNYLRMTGLRESARLSWDIEVLTLDEYRRRLNGKGIDVANVEREAFKNSGKEEMREQAFAVVEALVRRDPDHTPKVILFFSPPHLPHNYLMEGKARDRRVAETVSRAVEEAGGGETYAMKRFHPFLSDSSYLSMPETDEEISSLIDNFAYWNEHYRLPVADIRELSIPAINMGVYGKDAHQWTERVYKPYSFNVLPELIGHLTGLLLSTKN